MITKVLVVEDDPNMGQHLASCLKQDGFSVSLAVDRQEIEDTITAGVAVDVMVLDRLLEDYDCKGLVPMIKRRWPDCQILVLSAINTPNERTELLNLGADDYMGKPFSTQEVIARVNALRRRTGNQTSPYIQIGNTVIDLMRRTAMVQGKESSFPTKEFMVLKALSQTPGRVLNKVQLLDMIWGSNFDAETNVLEATVTHLRRRLQDLGSSLKIKNMRNAGYWIED